MNSLLAGESVSSAGKAVGITERTAYRWMSEDDFQTVYREAEKRLLENAFRKLESKAAGAVDALCEVLENPALRGANVKRLAAVSLLELLFKVKDNLDFEARLSALEDRRYVKNS